MTSDECNPWLYRQQIQIKQEMPGAHAAIVERHHDLLRCILHTTETQLAEEGVNMDFDIVLAECVFLSIIVMLSVAGFRRYQTLYRRLPAMMADFEPNADLILADNAVGVVGASRHHHRVREIALRSMVDMTPKQRVERAARTHSRRSVESLDLQVGDHIDFTGHLV